VVEGLVERAEWGLVMLVIWVEYHFLYFGVDIDDGQKAFWCCLNWSRMSSGFAPKRIPPLFRLVLVQAASISPRFTMVNSTF